MNLYTAILIPDIMFLKLIISVFFWPQKTSIQWSTRTRPGTRMKLTWRGTWLSRWFRRTWRAGGRSGNNINDSNSSKEHIINNIYLYLLKRQVNLFTTGGIALLVVVTECVLLLPVILSLACLCNFYIVLKLSSLFILISVLVCIRDSLLGDQ